MAACTSGSSLSIRKLIPGVGLIVVFILNACGENPPATQTQSIEEEIGIIVETAVAATRTGQAAFVPSQTSKPIPSSTQTGAPTLTPIPPSATAPIAAPVYRCQDSSFVKDVTIPDGTVLSPGEVFVKTWKFLNDGNCAWRSDYSIIFLYGDRMRGSDAEIGTIVDVDRREEVSVTMVAPSRPGRYHAYWQLADRNGYTFGEVVTVDITVANPTATSSPTIDHGSLQIIKTVNNPDSAVVPVNYAVDYNCGNGYAGRISVAPGNPMTIQSLPVGSVCTVVEIPPAAISGYTWSPVTYSPSLVIISARDQTFPITVGNSISRDRGSLQIVKTIANPDGLQIPAGFTINYTCGAGYSGQVMTTPGSPANIPGIPTGSICTVTEAAPNPIPGYTWAMATVNPASILIASKDQTYTVTVGNSLSRDHGSLQITKIVNNPDDAILPDSFLINYDCGVGYSGQVSVAPGAPGILSNIPTGSTCTVIEVDPDPIAGYIWEAAAYSPQSIIINARDQIFTISIGNSIAVEHPPMLTDTVTVTPPEEIEPSETPDPMQGE